jgi:hypothetical protein
LADTDSSSTTACGKGLPAASLTLMRTTAACDAPHKHPSAASSHEPAMDRV